LEETLTIHRLHVPARLRWNLFSTKSDLLGVLGGGGEM